MSNLKSNGLNFSKPLSPEQIANHKKMVEEGYKTNKIYSKEEMVIQPDDNEDWITTGYNHGHNSETK